MRVPIGFLFKPNENESQQSKICPLNCPAWVLLLGHRCQLNSNSIFSFIAALIIASVIVFIFLFVFRFHLLFPWLLIITGGRWKHKWLYDLNLHVFSICFFTYGVLEKRMHWTPLKYCLVEDGAHFLSENSLGSLLLAICEISWKRRKRILSIQLQHRHHLPLNVIRLLLTPSPDIMDPGPWIYEDRVGMLLWPLFLYQEQKSESFWYQRRKKVFLTCVFATTLYWWSPALWFGIQGDSRETERWASQLFFKKVALLAANPKQLSQL